MKVAIPLFLATASAHFWKRDEPQQSGIDVAVQYLRNIQELTLNTTAVTNDFHGELEEALAISTASTKVITETQNATAAVANIDLLSDNDATILGAYTQNLAYMVNQSIAATIQKKANFDKLSITSLVITSLQQQLNASAGFSLALTAKVPEYLRSVSAVLSSQINYSILQGIACFNGTNSSCIETVVDPLRTRNAAVFNEATLPDVPLPSILWWIGRD